MALSMKIFGVSEWSMRLPSAIMGTILILVIYRIAILLTKNKNVALLTSLMLAFSNFHLQMISGIHGMDHNDVAHGFYVLLSIWAFLEYKIKPNWKWIVLIGIFAGAAILNKWLTGLLVYLMWGTTILYSMYRKEFKAKQIFMMLISLFVCCLVFLPWQFYIFSRFPDLARHEFEFNRRHIFEALEGHSGTVFYYLEHLNNLVGNGIFCLILFGVIISIKDKRVNVPFNISILTAIIFVFSFFTFIVKTKVDTYVFFVVPLTLIYIAITIEYAFQKWLNNKYLRTLVCLIFIYLCVNPYMISKYLSPKNIARNDRIYNANIYRNLSKHLPKDVKVVMNMNSFEDIDVMFYNKGITAYHWTLSEADFKDFELKKIPIAVFEPHGNYNLPDYVLKYPYIFIIHEQLKNFD